ncbi:MAG: TonB-dependent receptor, partial [Blastocatellia bacterium]
GQSKVRNQNAVGGATYVFGPSLATDFRIGYTRYRVDVLPGDFGSNTGEAAGIPGVNLPNRPDTSGIPAFFIPGSGGFNFGYALAINQCNCPLNERYFEYQFVDNFTKVSGNHTYKWGVDVRFAGNLRRPSDTKRNGVFNFNQQVTGALGVAGSGLAAASFVLGLPTSFARFVQQFPEAEDRQWRMFYFAQDTWRATNKLTLNYGLRWDTWFPDTTLNDGQGSRYDVLTNTILVAGVGDVSKSVNVKTQWRNFSPRIGIAYQWDPKTVIRTGWGRSYFIEIFGFHFNNVANNFPNLITQVVNPASLFTPVFALTQGPPAAVFPAVPASGRLPLPVGLGFNYLPENQRYAYVDSWNLSVERLLGADTTVTASYVGNVGRNRKPGVLGPRGIALNQAVPGPGPLNPRRPLFNLFGLTQSINDFSTAMRSNYHALQTKLTRRLSEGSSLLVTYTWSKSMDYQWGMGTWFDLGLNRSVADYDRTHVFTVGHVWQLPFGKGRRFLANATRPVDYALGGWQFSGITRYESGWPFSPTLNNTSSINSDVPYLRPDVVASADPYAVSGGQSRDRWFNVAAFQTPAPFRFGNAARNSLRGPNFFTADWSLQKRFAIGESKGLSLRWEVFNAFNRTNLANPATAVDAGANAAGRITGLIIGGTMRRMQFGLRFEF